MNIVPTIYIDVTDQPAEEQDGFIYKFSFDEINQVTWFYSFNQTDQEVKLTDQYLLEETGISYGLIKKDLDKIHSIFGKQEYVDTQIGHPLVQYRAYLDIAAQNIYAFPEGKSFNKFQKTQIAHNTLVGGVYQTLLNSIEEYKIKRHISSVLQTSWVNKTNNFYINLTHMSEPYKKSLNLEDLEEIALNSDTGNYWKWNIIEESEANDFLTQTQKNQLQKTASNKIFTSMQEAKKHALESFEKISGEQFKQIAPQMTSVSGEYGTGIQYILNFPHPQLQTKFSLFDAFDLCSGSSGHYTIDLKLKQSIETSLPHIYIPHTYKTRVSILKLIHNILSQYLAELYDETQYQYALKKLYYDPPQIFFDAWWAYFVRPEINLQEVFV